MCIQITQVKWYIYFIIKWFILDYTKPNMYMCEYECIKE